jgi:conjugative transfer signal peptidase TraF
VASGDARGPDGPLFAWGEALRSAHASRRRLRRRAALVAIPALCALATAVAPPTPRLVWNASPSMAVGLYSVSPGASAATGELVVAWPPDRARRLAALRRYLPSNVPLVKRVAAMPGDEVCALGARIFINGSPSVTRRTADRAGRPLPWWEGCVRLREGQRLLLVAASPDSFDGRYFGVSERADILGKARLLWAR